MLNQTQNGIMYNTTFARVYKDAGNWKETGSFGRDDLLVVARAAELTSDPQATTITFKRLVSVVSFDS